MAAAGVRASLPRNTSGRSTASARAMPPPPPAHAPAPMGASVMTTRDMPRLHDGLKQGIGERGTHAGREAPSSGRGTDGPNDDREDRRPRRTGVRRGSFRLALSSLALLALIAAIGAITLCSGT